MQEGEALHRALPLKMRDRASIAAIILITALVSGNALGMGGQGHPLRPREYLDPFVSLVRGGYVLCYSSCAQPYGIDDLHAYRALLGARIDRFAFWAIWDACAHSLYRLDELRLRICVGSLRLPASIALEPSLRREVVKGFPAGHSTGIAAIVILHRTGLAFSVKRRIAGRTNGSAMIACSVRLDRLSLSAAGWGNGKGISLGEVEGEFVLERFMSIRTGYRLDTEEIRCGLGCRKGGILVTALWSHHPVLGRTVSLGVGYVWPR